MGYSQKAPEGSLFRHPCGGATTQALVPAIQIRGNNFPRSAACQFHVQAEKCHSN